MENLLGTDLFGEPIVQDGLGVLAEKFLVPPFTTLNSREGIWQERKRAWLHMGIKSEVGRGDNLLFGDNEQIAQKGLNYYREKEKEKEKSKYGKRMSTTCMRENYGSKVMLATSVFDPVLCELAYRWWCPVGGIIVDPFAGGSVRGIVASKLGYKYWGCDLSQEQISANIKQANDICQNAVNMPYWVCGDSMVTIPAEAPKADFIFSCPPYGDLEVYSDDPADISNMEYHTFKPAYKRIIHRACNQLKDNSFACFVVGDFRDKKTGYYRNFVSDTIEAFIEQGLGLYNEAILMTAIGSLPVRAGRQFTAGRKLGKAHQNVLVFVKGCGKAATKKIEGSGNENI